MCGTEPEGNKGKDGPKKLVYCIQVLLRAVEVTVRTHTLIRDDSEAYSDLYVESKN